MPGWKRRINMLNIRDIRIELVRARQRKHMLHNFGIHSPCIPGQMEIFSVDDYINKMCEQLDKKIKMLEDIIILLQGGEE